MIVHIVHRSVIKRIHNLIMPRSIHKVMSVELICIADSYHLPRFSLQVKVPYSVQRKNIIVYSIRRKIILLIYI